MLRDDFDGSWDVFCEQIARRRTLRHGPLRALLELYGYAAAYSPDPAAPGKALLPFELATGRLVDDVWAQWLEWDPVRMAPRHADALRSMQADLSRRRQARRVVPRPRREAFAAELDKLGVEHTLELFEGKHGGMTYRYPGAIRELVLGATVTRGRARSTSPTSPAR